MKVTVNPNKCHGHAMCVAKGPDVYKLNDDGYNEMGTFIVPKGLEDQARRGGRACPERAITIEEDAQPAASATAGASANQPR